MTLGWTNRPDQLEGTIEIGHLYLPLAAADVGAATPVTLQVELPEDSETAVIAVDYAGTRHRVTFARHTWQPITLYNPNARVIYVRVDDPRDRPAN